MPNISKVYILGDKNTLLFQYFLSVFAEHDFLRTRKNLLDDLILIHHIPQRVQAIWYPPPPIPQSSNLYRYISYREERVKSYRC
jgi:hypothetical protein